MMYLTLFGKGINIINVTPPKGGNYKNTGKKGFEPLKLDLKAGILPIKLFPFFDSAPKGGFLVVSEESLDSY